MSREPREILQDIKTIALVGISKDTKKDSFVIMKFLIERGYTVFPALRLAMSLMLQNGHVFYLFEIRYLRAELRLFPLCMALKVLKWQVGYSLLVLISNSKRTIMTGLSRISASLMPYIKS